MTYSMFSVLRLCRKRIPFPQKRLIHLSASNGIKNTRENEKKLDFRILLEEYKDKITFSSYLDHEKLELGTYKYYLKTIKQAKINKLQEHAEKCLTPLPVALKYYQAQEQGQSLNEVSEEKVAESERLFQLPFGKTKPIEIVDNTTKEPEDVPHTECKDEFDRSNIKKWMTNYEHFDDTQLEEDEDDIDTWPRYYGTTDPTAGISRVACGGCGALFHCSDPAIPGYLPSEIYKGRNDDELKTMECQRCHFLKEYNIALDVSVQPEEYEKLLQSIRYVKSLVVLMVDLLDFPCSIWPGIVDIIGKDRPLIIVGNKADLLPGDSVGYLKRVRASLLAEIGKTKLGEANIRDIVLISAKTGYGVENLITSMFKYWMYKGDVFLVGCTNVGKSSLFNTLLQSDYCKVHAADIVKRATVSRWPGTTLNLLKFPINRPSGWKIYQRTRRLKMEAKLMKVEKEIRKAQLEGKLQTEAPALIGHIGRSFSDDKYTHDVFSGQDKTNLLVMNEKHKLFANSKWFYDTPGVIHPDQVLPLLSTEELLLTIPKELIRPQTYYLNKGQSFFIGGVARLDLLDCDFPCRFTIFCSQSLPITVTSTQDADLVYEKFVGTELFAVPTGEVERLKNWPGLKSSEDLMEFEGEGPKWCCGDIVFSSVGWAGVTAKKGSMCTVKVWTPEGRGIYKRELSVLPYSINLKGKRVRDAPAYMVGKVFSEN